MYDLLAFLKVTRYTLPSRICQAYRLYHPQAGSRLSCGLYVRHHRQPVVEKGKFIYKIVFMYIIMVFGGT